MSKPIIPVLSSDGRSRIRKGSPSHCGVVLRPLGRHLCLLIRPLGRHLCLLHPPSRAASQTTTAGRSNPFPPAPALGSPEGERVGGLDAGELLRIADVVEARDPAVLD